MIIKRVTTIFILYSVIFFLIPSLASQANSGPPSNLRLTIVNADFDYYFEVLTYQDSPLTTEQIDRALYGEFYNKEGEPNPWSVEYPMVFDMPQMLASFQDKDGYVSYTLHYRDYEIFEYRDKDDEISPSQFTIWLNPPRQFKLMLIGENDQVIISEVVVMKQYDYRVTWDLEGVSYDALIQYDSGVVTGLILHPFLRISTYIDFFIRLFVTLAIEVGLLYAFGFRKNMSYAIAFGVNVISQSILTIGTIFTFYLSTYSPISVIYYYIVGEFFIFTGEMLIYAFILKEKPIHIRIIYGFIANFFSMIIGLMIAITIFGYLAR